MKRPVILVALFVLAVGSAVDAAYTIQLTNGKTIVADEAPIIKSDLAYFTKNGLYLYLPASQIDAAKTEALNVKAEAPKNMELFPEEAVQPEAVTPVFVDDQKLDLIRQRSRLANEGELLPPAPAELDAEAAGKAPSSKAPPRPAGPSGPSADALRSQLNDLIGQRTLAQQRRNDLQEQYKRVEDQYNFSSLQDDKERYQQQMDSIKAQMADAQNDVSRYDGQIQSTQQQIAGTPIIIPQEAAPAAEPDTGPGT